VLAGENTAMAEIEFDVYYAPERSDGVFFEEMQTVSRLTNFLVSRFRLPDTSSQGMRIEYGLFLDKQGLPLDPGKTLRQAGIRTGSTVYLADKTAPWWYVSELRNPPEPETGQLPPPPNPDSYPKPRLVSSSVCRMYLVPKSPPIPVTGNKVVLNRQYLLQNLSSEIKLKEKLRRAAYGESPLDYVSRTEHCTIFRYNEQWYLKARRDTYVDNELISQGEVKLLDRPQITLVLGAHQRGWKITVEILSSESLP
jgi:hypothetical protein